MQDRAVLHIGALTYDHRPVVGAQHGVEPHRRTGLDVDIADQRGGWGDEGSGVNPRRSAFEGKQRHRSDIPQVGYPALRDRTEKL
jgi:hypothetical protein